MISNEKIEVTFGARGCGKTIEMIKMSARTKCIIVCPKETQVHRLKNTAKQMGYDIPDPIGWDKFTDYCAHGEEDVHGFLIDGLDEILQNISGRNVRAVNFNDQLTSMFPKHLLSRELVTTK